ncbi:hypothetical protein SKAU_G00063110 [Synaphobranchus kaupii]|uniref:SCAN box domain-containing protein n=1 Tax=Synaphobranchus kaupii TaxID=118154 RepID=A0A9Q1G5S9_SYNKA|nr:hypothetical protein SKAU_G00063110 [Synaphobranchus kaupii]
MLEASLQSQQVTQQIAASLGKVTEELVQLKITTVQGVSLPDPRTTAHQLLTKLMPQDDVDAFFHTFELVAQREARDQRDWAQVLAPFLTVEAQQAYYLLPLAEAHDYDMLKEVVVAHLGMSFAAAGKAFRSWRYNHDTPARAQMAQLLRLTHHWLQSNQRSAVQVAGRVAMDRFLWALPEDKQSSVGLKAPTKPREMMEVVDVAQATLTMSRQGFRPRRESLWHRRRHRDLEEMEPRSAVNTPMSARRAPPPQDVPIPTNPGARAGLSNPKTWLAGCSIHGGNHHSPLTREVKIAGKSLVAWGGGGCDSRAASRSPAPLQHSGIKTKAHGAREGRRIVRLT